MLEAPGVSGIPWLRLCGTVTNLRFKLLTWIIAKCWPVHRYFRSPYVIVKTFCVLVTERRHFHVVRWLPAMHNRLFRPSVPVAPGQPVKSNLLTWMNFSHNAITSRRFCESKKTGGINRWPLLFFTRICPFPSSPIRFSDHPTFSPLYVKFFRSILNMDPLFHPPRAKHAKYILTLSIYLENQIKRFFLGFWDAYFLRAASTDCPSRKCRISFGVFFGCEWTFP